MKKKYASVRIEKIQNNRVISQVNHDMRIGYQPSYIDYTKMKDNYLIYKNEKYDKQKIYDLKKEQNKRSKRKIQKNTERFFTGIISFSPEMSQDFKNNRELFNKCAENFLNKLETEEGLQVCYAINHLDEKTPHIHLLFDNIDKNGKSIRRNIKPETLARFQDLLADSYKQMNYERGERNSKRKHLNVKELHELNELKNKLRHDCQDYKNELKIFDKILENEKLTEEEKEILKALAPTLFQFVEKNDREHKKELSNKIDKVLRNKNPMS